MKCLSLVKTILIILVLTFAMSLSGFAIFEGGVPQGCILVAGLGWWAYCNYFSDRH